MKKNWFAISLGLCSFLVQATTFEIKLTENFLKQNGEYEFKLNVVGGTNKIFRVTVNDGKVVLFGSGAKFNEKTKAILVKAGLTNIKEARDLEIRGITGFFKGQATMMGQIGNTKDFVVDLKPGLTLNFE